MRFVICEPGPQSNPWDMPAATRTPTTWVHGGQRTLYCLAAALAATGRNVELRGEICPVALQETLDAANVHVALPTAPRRPDADDVVITTAGLRDPLHFARLAISGARPVIMLLDPPGLMGWPFTDSWKRPDPLTVVLDTLARPEHFRAMTGCGFALWSHSRGIASAAEAAGVSCSWVGVGEPGAFPEAEPKRYDAALIEDNRWAPLAHRVAEELDCTVARIGKAPRLELLRQLGEARTLIWPSRVEGHARIQCEARAMGTVPVALRNPYAAGLSEEGGAVVVESVADIAPMIGGLLANPTRLGALAAAGRSSVRAAEDWGGFVDRVDAVAQQVEASPPRGGVGGFGADIQRVLAGPAEALGAGAAAASLELQRTQAELAQTQAALNALLDSRGMRVLERARRLRR